LGGVDVRQPVGLLRDDRGLDRKLFSVGVEAIRVSRELWGNVAAACAPNALFKEVGARKKKSPAPRSATEIADRCIETVRAVVERTIAQLQRVHAPRAKFELLFEALGETIVDVQRQAIDTDDGARRRIRQCDQD
jgi:hypothetical protein